MKTYYFRIYQCNDEDGDTVWTIADSASEAESNIREEYYDIDRLELIGSK